MKLFQGKNFILGVFVGALLVTAGSAFAEDGLSKIEAYLRPNLPITLNGEPLQLENAPVMVDGSTYLKLRDVANVTGLGVNWNDTTQTVELSTDKNGGVASTATQTDDMDQPTKDKLSQWEQDRAAAQLQDQEAKEKIKAEQDAANAERERLLKEQQERDKAIQDAINKDNNK